MKKIAVTHCLKQQDMMKKEENHFHARGSLSHTCFAREESLYMIIISKMQSREIPFLYIPDVVLHYVLHITLLMFFIISSGIIMMYTNNFKEKKHIRFVCYLQSGISG